MNPSTQEILAAFENLPTDNVIILPNNKNIVMTSNQAKEVTVKNVAVVASNPFRKDWQRCLSITRKANCKRSQRR